MSDGEGLPLAPVRRWLLHPRFRHQWGVWLALVLMFGGLVALMQWREHRTIARAEQAHLQSQVRIAERLFVGQIESVDAALRTMVTSIDRWRGADGYLPFAHDHLRRVEAMMPGAQAFMVLDARGICQLSSSPDLLGLDFSRSPFFREAQAAANPLALQVSTPFRSVLGVWSVTVSRTLYSGQGQFTGVVASVLSPEYFQTLMHRLRYADDMRVALIHGRGLIYVSSPPGEEMRQVNFQDGDNFFSHHRALGAPESYQEGYGLDDRERMAMLQTVALPSVVPGDHFVAVATRESDAVFSQWRRDSWTHTGFLVFVSLISGLALARYQSGAQALLEKATRSEQAMLRSNERFEQLASTVPGVLFDFELMETNAPRLVYVSPYSTHLLGLSPEELMTVPRTFISHVHPNDAPGFEESFSASIQRGESVDCELRYVRPDGQVRWLRLSATPARSDANLPHWSGFLFDVSEARTQQQALHQMAYQDPLTGAANRRHMMDMLHTELARVQRSHAHASFIMLDVDFFKKINDIHGHDAGDEVLKHLVQVLQQALRSVDTLARMGGEEFAILLPETSLDAAVRLAERLRQAVQSKPLDVAGQPLGITISLGVASFGDDEQDINRVIKRADLAMYQAKQTGRNRVCSANAS